MAPYVRECSLASSVILAPSLKRCVSRLSSSSLHGKPWFPFSARVSSWLVAKNSVLMISGWLYGLSAGNIKLTGLDRLKVTLKIIKTDNKQNAYRHNLDLYNGIQTEQLIEKASEILDISMSETSQVISRLITELENYQSTRLEEMKPKQPEKRELSEAERKQAVNFLKSANLLERTKEAIKLSGLIGEETNSMIAYLTYTSRKRHVPLHLMCLGASGTGKTWLQEKVSELMPKKINWKLPRFPATLFITSAEKN